MSLRRKLFSGTAHTLAAGLGLEAISLVTAIIYARLLGKESLGVLAILWQISAAIIPLSSLGINTAITKMIPDHQRGPPEEMETLLSSAFALTLAAGLSVSIGYFVMAELLASIYGVPELVLLIRVSASMVVLNALVVLAAAIVQGFQRVKELAWLAFVAQGVAVPVTFYMTMTWGLLGAVLAGAVSLAMTVGIYFRAVRAITSIHKVRITLSRADRKTVFSILHLALPLFASFVVLRPALLFQSSFLALRLGYGDLGLFRVASILYGAVLLIPVALSIPLLPAISQMYSEETRERTRGQLSYLIRIVALLCLPIALTMGLGSGLIIGFLFGQEYLGAAPLVFIMSVAAFVDTIGVVVDRTLLGTGRTLLVLLLTILHAAVLSLGSFILISTFGLSGIGLAVLLSGAVHVLVLGGYFLNKLELSFRTLWPSLALAMGAFLVACLIVLLGGLNNLLLPAAFLVVLLIVELKLLSTKDWALLRDVLRGAFARDGK